jgi:hypothetical protein
MSTVEQARVILDPKKLGLPKRPPITGIKVDEYYSATGTGGQGLRVQVILSEDTTDDDITGEAVIEIKSAIRAALRSKDIEDFAYVFFAKQSELNNLDETE